MRALTSMYVGKPVRVPVSERVPRERNGVALEFGFKHDPAVGRHAARLLTCGLDKPEPRSGLAGKGEVQHREVH